MALEISPGAKPASARRNAYTGEMESLGLGYYAVRMTILLGFLNIENLKIVSKQVSNSTKYIMDPDEETY